VSGGFLNDDQTTDVEEQVQDIVDDDVTDIPNHDNRLDKEPIQ
jgi:hypothetical protein